jgi:MFS family permease
MGYGGGAMIGAPLAVWLMSHFGGSGGAPAGVSHALVTMGVIYFIAMSAGALGFRVPPPGWRPTGWTPPAGDGGSSLITRHHVHLNESWRTPQFWLIWGVLGLNVTAGIGVISMASPMFQDIFGAKLLGVDSAAALTAAQKAAVVAAAAGLVGLISLFNSLGRIFWASLSDKIGRKTMYYTIFILGIVLYCLLPTWGHLGIASLFVISICIIFGTQMVGAIHGRLITSWSVAGVVGPALIASLRQFQIDHGVAHAQVYDITLYIMAFLLFGGLICNAFVKPVNPKHWMTDEQLARERSLQHEDRIDANAETSARGSFGIGGVLAWLAVGIPFCIGLYIALQKAAALF